MVCEGPGGRLRRPYAISPIDLIPDAVPILGQVALGFLDDLVIVPLGIMLAIKLIPDDLMAEFREEATRLIRSAHELCHGRHHCFALARCHSSPAVVALDAPCGIDFKKPYYPSFMGVGAEVGCFQPSATP